MSEYLSTRKGIILNFSNKFCTTDEELLNSKTFNKVLSKYINSLKTKKHFLYTDYLKSTSNINLLVDIYKLLMCFDYEDILNHNKYLVLTKDRESLYKLTEGFYDYWRKLERFAVINSKNKTQGFENASFVEATERFTNLVLKVYRRATQNILNEKFRVYRELPAGVNASILLSDVNWVTDQKYLGLKNIDFINSISLRPPFISYTNKNKRDGYFEEIDTNPIENVKLNQKDYLCYPARVGQSLAYLYLHKDYLGSCIALANLFQIDTSDNLNNTKPDLIFVYGAPNENKITSESIKFHHDKENDIYVGVAYYGDDIDYFGYLKKMMLTLHNVKMINNGYLPIHGACVNIKLKNRPAKTVVIIGDSGAGKSESLEALRSNLGDEINEIKTIFDDMGTFKFVGKDIYAYGTEIGAFVRLDDLENGYAMKEMDRAIFTNPDKTNSRLVMPISNYNDITCGFKVDIVLYANNYTDKESEINYLNTLEECMNVFK